MATLPDYDPNEPGKYPFDALRNRVICDIAEPGSTFKIIPISGGLEEGLVNLNTPIFCEYGHFFYAGKTLHEAEARESFGNMTVSDILMHSLNVGAAKVGIMLGEDRLYNYIRRYGVGSKTGIALPGEVSGILHPVKAWSKLSIARIPMGQGVSVTPLQMVMAMGAIANKGVLMKPMLVDRLMDENGNLVAKYEPQVVGRAVSERTAKDMVTALKRVPTANGTAEAAALEHYTVAGKTGTAVKNLNGQYIDKYFSSFIGFFPADNPELCISVVIDDPPKHQHFGGKVAGPIFHNIAERAASYFNIKPDIDPDADPASISSTTLATVTGTVSAATHKPISGKVATK
jgi:cell division protein FtsI/penicillin-binding protein 2